MYGSLRIDLGHGFLDRLQNNADLYRSRLEQALNERTRSTDRCANLQIAELASRLAERLGGEADGWCAEGVPSVRALPWPPERRAWLAEVRDLLLFVWQSIPLETDISVGAAEAAGDLESLAAQLCLTDQARVHLMHTLHAGMGESETFISLTEALELIASAATKAHGCWRATRGPEPRSALQLLVADIYAAFVEARGEPLKLLVADTAGYTGQPENDDTRFLLDFVNSVHEAIPAELRKRQPHLTHDGAILNAYKEHSEAMNRAAKLPA